jgi:hypothetical protein
VGDRRGRRRHDGDGEGDGQGTRLLHCACACELSESGSSDGVGDRCGVACAMRCLLRRKRGDRRGGAAASGPVGGGTARMGCGWRHVPWGVGRNLALFRPAACGAGACDRSADRKWFTFRPNKIS